MAYPVTGSTVLTGVQPVINDSMGASWWARNSFKDPEAWPVFSTAITHAFPIINPTDLRVLKRMLDPSQKNTVSFRAFANFLKWFGPFELFVKKIRHLIQNGGNHWFHGFLASTDATALLTRYNAQGTFLVRFSESEANNGGFSISVVDYTNTIRHWKGIYNLFAKGDGREGIEYQGVVYPDLVAFVHSCMTTFVTDFVPKDVVAARSGQSWALYACPESIFSNIVYPAEADMKTVSSVPEGLNTLGDSGTYEDVPTTRGVISPVVAAAAVAAAAAGGGGGGGGGAAPPAAVGGGVGAGVPSVAMGGAYAVSRNNTAPPPQPSNGYAVNEKYADRGIEQRDPTYANVFGPHAMAANPYATPAKPPAEAAPPARIYPSPAVAPPGGPTGSPTAGRAGASGADAVTPVMAGLSIDARSTAPANASTPSSPGAASSGGSVAAPFRPPTAATGGRISVRREDLAKIMVMLMSQSAPQHAAGVSALMRMVQQAVTENETRWLLVEAGGLPTLVGLLPNINLGVQITAARGLGLLCPSMGDEGNAEEPSVLAGHEEYRERFVSTLVPLDCILLLLTLSQNNQSNARLVAVTTLRRLCRASVEFCLQLQTHDGIRCLINLLRNPPSDTLAAHEEAIRTLHAALLVLPEVHDQLLDYDVLALVLAVLTGRPRSGAYEPPLSPISLDPVASFAVAAPHHDEPSGVTQLQRLRRYAWPLMAHYAARCPDRVLAVLVSERHVTALGELAQVAESMEGDRSLSMVLSAVPMRGGQGGFGTYRA